MVGWLVADPRAVLREIPPLGLEWPNAIYNDAFQTWSETDSEAAIAFLNQVPAASRDAAVMGIFDHALYSANDAGLAERMYDRLAGDEARQRAAATLHSMFQAIDPQRAERYRRAAGS
ncbi:MAG: hypothetical protein OXK76_10145 [Gammaproteobacteria bacterium]|nr:hypothetical protein [Gammaproteobacteria bacterium]